MISRHLDSRRRRKLSYTSLSLEIDHNIEQLRSMLRAVGNKRAHLIPKLHLTLSTRAWERIAESDLLTNLSEEDLSLIAPLSWYVDWLSSVIDEELNADTVIPELMPVLEVMIRFAEISSRGAKNWLDMKLGRIDSKTFETNRTRILAEMAEQRRHHEVIISKTFGQGAIPEMHQE